MNSVQKELLSFILKRTLETKKDKAELLLLNAFTQQEKGALTSLKLEALTAKLLPLVIPKNLDEVKKALVKFGADTLKGEKTKMIGDVAKIAKKAAVKTVTKKSPVKKAKPTKKTNSSW